MKAKQKLQDKPTEQSPHRKLEETRVMVKSNGAVKAYSANTYQGLVRNYNEDRVSIILNISKPDNQNHWPKCSYFGVFDGHGGSTCSDYLRDNLHKFIIEDKNFPFKPVEALKNGFHKAEKDFLKLAESTNPIQKSGSCALIVLIIDDKCYVANVGDSRAILSRNKGTKIVPLSVDHKPDSESQRQRIERHGGSVYQSSITTKRGDSVPGPFRILPGRLSVSRAIGDIYAKAERLMGNPNVLIGEPEIKQFYIDQTHDFILLGCDGVFDKLSNWDVNDVVWKARKAQETENGFLRQAISGVIQQSMAKRSLDNLTAVLILLGTDDKISKKSHSTTSIGYGNTQKDKMTHQQKLKTCSKQQLLRLTKFQRQKTDTMTRRISLDTNKENTNQNNMGHLYQILPNTHLVQNKYNNLEKDIPKLRKKQSQHNPKKLELSKFQTVGRNKTGEYIRY